MSLLSALCHFVDPTGRVGSKLMSLKWSLNVRVGMNTHMCQRLCDAFCATVQKFARINGDGCTSALHSASGQFAFKSNCCEIEASNH